MQTVHTRQQLKSTIRSWKEQGQIVAFVPTMGNLHDGHLHLIKAAKQRADRVVVSIFVNPMQFGKNEDIDAYPRTLEQDSARLALLEVDLLFAPAVSEVYPVSLDKMTRIEVPGISDVLCGEHRPGHFSGVATVVTKLFNMVQPDIAVFGEKDFQQLLVIRTMVRDLDQPVEILGVATVRESDGLAMSSRNSYLSEEERKKAPFLYQTLREMIEAIRKGNVSYLELEESAAKKLENAGFRPDYVNIRNANSLQPASIGDHALVVLAAAWLGKARLIDNIAVTLKG
jgi:pantoate--beta-alanine ligase